MVKREGVPQWNEVSHCSVLYWQEVGAVDKDESGSFRHTFKLKKSKKK